MKKKWGRERDSGGRREGRKEGEKERKERKAFTLAVIRLQLENRKKCRPWLL